MNQYRRIVSYLYQYLNGEKGQNIGYAKLEQKGRQCRITVQMRAVETSFMPEVWLFKQEPSAIEYVSIGRLSAHSGSLQVKTVASSEDVCSSGHPASDFDGAVIYISDKEYYATSWTNESIYIGNKINMLDRDAHNGSREDSVAENTHDIPANGNTIVDNNTIADSESIDNKAGGKSDSAYNEIISSVEADSEPGNSVADSSSEADNIDSSSTGKDKSIETSADNNDNIVDNAVKDNSQENNKSALEQDVQEADIKTQDIGEEKNVYGCSACPYKNYNKKDEDFGVRILRNFPVMYPFKSGSIEESVRIEPKDIGCMPIRLWSFANNRFLLHGYYCYKHLIFAKLGNGCYALGVPGVYSEQESKRATAFSFNSFQPIGPGKIMYGVFGYWIAEINI